MTTAPYTFDAAVAHHLDNGITVTLEPLPYLRSASAGIWVKTGSANECEGEGGLAHLLEHLFFKGTKSRSVREIMEAVEGKGGHLNAFTSREHTCLYVKMLDRHLDEGIEILTDLFINSLFADLEKERNVVLEEIASIKDTPDDYIHDLLTEHHWPDHPLGRPVSGRHDTVSALKRDHVQDFYNRWYVPENTFISVAGNIDAEAVLRQIQAAFKDVPVAPSPALPSAPVFSGGIKTVERDIAQAHLCLAFPGPVLSDEERFNCDLASSLLGGGSTSRLFERIREEEGLAYAIYTFHSFYKQAGMLGLYAAVAPQNYERTLDLIFEELRRLRDEAVDEAELDMNREQIKGNMFMALESTSTRMSRMAKSIMNYGRIIPLDEVIQKINDVTPALVQRYAQEAFQPDRCALVALGRTNGYDLQEIPL